VRPAAARPVALARRRGYHPGPVRLLVVLMLVHGLAPGLAEVGEAAVHWVRTGHVAHSAADHGDLGDQGSEHGCGTTQHRCTCCSAQVFAPAAPTVIASVQLGTERTLAPAALTLAVRAPSRPFRPPIS
jgi:hypothetical protein